MVQVSRFYSVLAILGFYAGAAATGGAMWLYGLPESLLILFVIPVLLAAVYLPRYVYALMAVGGLGMSLLTMHHVSTTGITGANYQTIFLLFIATGCVAESIHRVVKRLRRTQRRLEQSEARFRALVENSPDGILVLTDEKVRFANPAACVMLGVDSPQELAGVNGYDFVHPGDRARARRGSTNTVRGVGDNEPEELRILRRDGRVIEVAAMGMPIEFEDEAGMQVVMRDVTERNRLQREKGVMDAQMRQTQKLESLGVLAGGIAHEFNNILVGIMGNAQLLLNGIPKDDPKRKHYLTIVDAAHRATGLCVQMRAYTGDDQGQSAIALDISKEVLHIERLLGVIGIDTVELKFDLGDNLPRVKMDPAQLQQILVTLVTNAAEAIGSSKGTITVRTGKMECDAVFLSKGGINDDFQPGTYVFLKVKDNGCGISDEVRDKIFDPFFTTKFAGRGLGLAAVAGMVRSCHGDIRIESAVGEGSTFTVLLPISQGPSPDSLEAYNYVPKVALRGEGAVLIVDADDSACRYGRQVLERSGFTVASAQNLADGLELFHEWRDRLKAMFINPTSGDEKAVQAWKKAHAEHGAHIPVVLMGNFHPPGVADAFSNAHPVSFLAKPFKRQDMLLTLQKAMARVNSTVE